MSTSGAAECLGESERLGTLAAGFAADLAFYTHDPLQNPRNFRTLQWTLKGGEWIAAGPLEYPPAFDLDYWIHQWELNQKRGPRETPEG
jgi:formylmethanofuran dehydrogenase subunit A